MSKHSRASRSSGWRNAFATSSSDPSEILKYCGQIGSDDLIDPKDLIQSTSKSSGVDRKTLQLCAAVRRVVEQLLSGETGDPVMSECEVVDVLPNPNAARLRVVIIPPAEADPADVLARLGRASGWMRAEISTSIRRRKTPELAFALAERGSNH